MSKSLKVRFLAWVMGALQAFIGLSAVAGGYQLVTNPGGSPAMPVEMLQASPFATFLIPGIVLMVCIGAVNVFSLVVTMVGSRLRGSVAAVGGVILIGYMTAEVWWVGLQNALQPLFFGLGVVLLLSGLALRRTLLGATVGSLTGS